MRRYVVDECRHVLILIVKLIMLVQFLQDALFSAIAAIGFASISNPPRSAYLYCAFIAAAGHSSRFLLMELGGVHIAAATALASLIIGVLAVVLSPRNRVPAETYLYPSLLPMIPGVYAYRTFGALMMCLRDGGESSFNHYFYLFSSNGLTCFFILLGMAVGATVPMFMMKKISFQATRRRENVSI